MITTRPAPSTEWSLLSCLMSFSIMFSFTLRIWGLWSTQARLKKHLLPVAMVNRCRKPTLRLAWQLRLRRQTSSIVENINVFLVQEFAVVWQHLLAMRWRSTKVFSMNMKPSDQQIVFKEKVSRFDVYVFVT